MNACFGQTACQEAWLYLLDHPDDVAGAKTIAATYCIYHWDECAGDANFDQFVSGAMYDALMLMGLRAGGAGKTGAAGAQARLPQDIAVSPTPPRALPLNRPVGRASHNRALQADIAALPNGATDIRVNQQQVNAKGERVGINRPDLQYTLNGKRYYVEYEGPANPRGDMHEARIMANDPDAIFILRLVP